MSYDSKVFELGWDFILTGERYRELDKEKVPLEDQYEMCGLFKQSTFGDIDINCHGAEDPVLGNCKAWAAKRGLSKEEAIKKHVTKADQLVAAYKS